MQPIYTGQGIAKDCVIGDRNMNRYGVFNGLERPRRIDNNLNATILGFDVPVVSGIVNNAGGGSIASAIYSYRVVYASSIFTRPVAVLDNSIAYTRGNGSAASTGATVLGSATLTVVGSSDLGVDKILVYRSKGQSTAVAAEAGPHYLAAVANNTSGNVVITDTTIDASLGTIAIETDNYPPNSYRYAIAAASYLFSGGSMPLGTGYTCTVTPGSSTVTVSSPILYDGVRGWFFRLPSDTTGGVNGQGLYYANYVTSTTLQLIDASGTAKTYNGSLTGSGQTFTLALAGNVLRWSKYAEPEAWPLENTIDFEGEITGIGLMPNLAQVIVFTDEPSIWMLDLGMIGSDSFKKYKRLISSEHTTSSHYSVCPVDGKLRAIDFSRKCIIEYDGYTVKDITKIVIPDIWRFLEPSYTKSANWHCAYDQAYHLFGAFVTFANSHKTIDFCIGQNTITGGWFFNFEKDLLCTGKYVDPVTNEQMILGGTEGNEGFGARWGRIWTPGTYSEWLPVTGLTSGTILSATATSITVDVTSANLNTTGTGLAGLWVLVTDANGENSMMAYISQNTTNVISVWSVVNSTIANQFSTVPVAGWKFYVGMIEMRWGPKRFDFNDSDNEKKVKEVILTATQYDENNVPVIRTYRGYDAGYDKQHTLIPSTFRNLQDGTPGAHNQNLYSRYDSHGEDTARWGVAIVDRCYNQTAFRNLSIVFEQIAGVKRGNK